MSKLIRNLGRTGFSPQRIIRITEALLAAVLAVAVADLVWSLTPPPVSRDISPGSAGKHLISHYRSAYNRPLADKPSTALKSLFGTAPIDAETSGLTEKPVRETNLNLTLKGILADRDSGKKLALIAQGSNEDTVSRVGDMIAGAKIIRIDSRRVILRRNGINESLSMEMEELQLKPSENTNSASFAGDNGNNLEINKTGPKMISKHVLDHHLDNLPRLLKQAKTVPYTKDGAAAGFQVVQIDKGSIFNDLGLKQNDIIRSVNGIPVHSTGEALQAYRKLKTVTAFQVDILRNDRQITLNYSIQ